MSAPSGENIMTQSAEGISNILQQQVVHPPAMPPHQIVSSGTGDTNVPIQYSQTPAPSEVPGPPNAIVSEPRETNDMNLQNVNYASEFFFNYYSFTKSVRRDDALQVHP